MLLLSVLPFSSRLVLQPADQTTVVLARHITHATFGAVWPIWHLDRSMMGMRRHISLCLSRDSGAVVGVAGHATASIRRGVLSAHGVY